MLVKDAMSQIVVSAGPDMTLRQVAGMLLEYGFNALPVSDENGQLVGMIGIRDLLTAPSRATAHENVTIDQKLSVWERTLVKQLMVDRVITVEENAPLMRAAALMANVGVHPLPVMRGKQMIGVITRSDVIKALLQASGATYRPVA
jgi:acetoin utilization protein AcuB